MAQAAKDTAALQQLGVDTTRVPVSDALAEHLAKAQAEADAGQVMDLDDLRETVKRTLARGKKN